jgi:NADH-quinone oxidoreductase subunit N
MLAYSSIAHAGYLLLGIIAATVAGKAAILFYLLSYAVSNLGALGIVALLGTSQNQHDELRDFGGLWRSRPGLAALMTVFLLSLGGIPPTAGFIGKWYIFSAAVQEGHYWLAIIGVLSSVVSVFFYLRIVVMMYMTEGPDTIRPRVPGPAVAGLALATFAVFYLGVLPARVLDIALESISTIFEPR